MRPPLPFSHHLLIGLFLGATVIAGYFVSTAGTGRSSESMAKSKFRAEERPLHLAAMDANPGLPAYLLKLCGPEVMEIHGGRTEDGRMPDWFLEAARKLAASGLKWPAPTVGTDDPILMANVREQEARFASMLATDPEGAVLLLEPLVRYEEDKFKARFWRSRLESSAAAHGGTPDAEVYLNMLADLPDRYFSMMIVETLERNPDPGLAGIAISQSMRRGPIEKLSGLAVIAGNHSLDLATRDSAARLLAPALNVTIEPGTLDGLDWAFEVAERFLETPQVVADKTAPPP